MRYQYRSMRRAWVFMDVLMGIILVGIIAATLGSAAAWHVRALAHLSDSRAAARAAEAALVSLQAGEAPAPPGNARLKITALPDPSIAPEMAWASVDASVNHRHVVLIGLVPVASLRSAAATAGGL